MRFISVFMLALMPLALSAQAGTGAVNKQKKGPVMEFEQTEFNFGLFDIEHGDKECYFVFKNTGDAPLIISSAVASCGCTVPQYPTNEIKPGAKDSIKVSYAGSTRRPGVFKKVVTVTYNNDNDNIAKLYISGEMVDKETMDKMFGAAE